MKKIETKRALRAMAIGSTNKLPKQLAITFALHVFVFAGACDNPSTRPKLREYSQSDPIASIQNWPSALKNAFDKVQSRGIPVDGFRVYKLHHDEFFFEFHSTAEMESSWIESLELREVGRSERYIERFLTRIPTSYNRPEGILFANSNRVDGEKGDQIVLMRVGSSSDLYIGHYYFNF